MKYTKLTEEKLFKLLHNQVSVCLITVGKTFVLKVSFSLELTKAIKHVTALKQTFYATN